MKSSDYLRLGPVRALFPTCQDVTRLQSRAMDESLPTYVLLGLRLHLLLCRWCRRYGKQLHFLREALRRPDEPSLLEESRFKLTAAARETIKITLRKER